MGRVSGKVAIVTGGASGIGRACAQKLAAQGAAVCVTDIDTQIGDAVATQICESGGDAMFLEHDVTSEARWQEVVTSVTATYGKLNVLVNNAGIFYGGPTETFELEQWRRQIGINLDGVFLGTKHAIPIMRVAQGGSIIMLSSVAGLIGAANFACYSATKGAVRLFTKAVAKECASDGIRVNSVHPGIIETPIWQKINNDARPEPTGPVEIAKARVPIGTPGTAEMVADGVVFLASDESKYMTGSELVIDGGMTA
ncbi:MAG: glucose 1-dehydrogenase [Gammaproteobacteria bacterium]|nr:glucose 1-dehydrogenase [Gammaproteobacteria bacterium]